MPKGKGNYVPKSPGAREYVRNMRKIAKEKGDENNRNKKKAY